ncbi:hypothetical protein Y1Q_0015594 [Alligator mississippiensis]|uniref:Uncharacterized protein n=1 Tax=Alligator mississippiensis TaxID=8496 RepID=A0A151NNH5_ALLMI|nr:hypothetical protein Y1Q_0015594 [Alligator mississippiensis]
MSGKICQRGCLIQPSWKLWFLHLNHSHVIPRTPENKKNEKTSVFACRASYTAGLPGMSLTAIDAAITLISGCDLPCIQKNFTCATASKWCSMESADLAEK